MEWSLFAFDLVFHKVLELFEEAFALVVVFLGGLIVKLPQGLLLLIAQVLRLNCAVLIVGLHLMESVGSAHVFHIFGTVIAEHLACAA